MEHKAFIQNFSLRKSARRLICSEIIKKKIIIKSYILFIFLFSRLDYHEQTNSVLMCVSRKKQIFNFENTRGHELRRFTLELHVTYASVLQIHVFSKKEIYFLNTHGLIIIGKYSTNDVNMFFWFKKNHKVN